MKVQLLLGLELSIRPIPIANTMRRKAPETFETTKAPLRYPNRYIVFRAAPNRLL